MRRIGLRFKGLYVNVLGLFNYNKYKKLYNKKKIEKYKNCHPKSNIFVVGAGPSLEYENLNLLKNQVVISLNAARKLVNDLDVKNHYWCVADGNRMNLFSDESRENLNASFRYLSPIKMKLKQTAISNEDVVLLYPTKKKFLFFLDGIRDVERRFDTFPLNLEEYASGYGSGTVLFPAIQMAAYLGARNIILLGADFGVENNGKTHAIVFEKSTRELKRQGNAFGFWQFKYEAVIRPHLRLYQDLLANIGVNLYNSSFSISDDVLTRVKLIDFV